MATPSPDSAPRDELVPFGDWLARWQRRLLALFAALLAIGSVAIGLVQWRYAGVDDPVALRDTRTAAAMVAALTAQNGGAWPTPTQAVPPGKAVCASGDAKSAVRAAASASAAASSAARAASAASAAVATAGSSSPAASAAVASAAIGASAAERAAVAAAAASESAPGAVTACASVPETYAGPTIELAGARLALGVDSLFVVPATTGLFMLAIAFLFLRARPAAGRASVWPGVEWREIVLQLLCVIPAAAAAFDLAGNGVTMIAIEDAVSGVLVDATVADMNLATTCKWALFALSCLVAAAFALGGEWRRGRAGTDTDDGMGVSPRLDPWLVASGIAGLVATLALLAWLAWPSPPLRDVGTIAFAVQMAAVGRRVWQPVRRRLKA